MEKAFDRILMGLSKKTIMTEYDDKLKTAYHEAGHTLMSLLVDGAMKLHKVTILPRGQALGFTAFVPEKDIKNYSKKDLMGNLYSSLGGRAAEEIVYGNEEITTGCGSDLVGATEIV